jgi:hypothetical protein
MLSNNDRSQIIPISKGLFSSKKKSKANILKDIINIDKTNQNRKLVNGEPIFNNIINYFKRVANIYKEYNIIDSSTYSKIDSLSNEYNRKYNSITVNSSKSETNKRTLQESISSEYGLKMTEIIRPFQKKFLDKYINKNIRISNGHLNNSTKIHRILSKELLAIE